MTTAAMHLSYQSQEDLRHEWETVLVNRYGEDAAQSNALATYVAFLSALEWTGTGRQVIEALPAGKRVFSSNDIRDSWARLGLITIPTRRKLPASALPCIAINRRGEMSVVVSQDPTGYLIADGQFLRETKTVKRLPRGDLFIVEPRETARPAGQRAASEWLRETLFEFRKVIRATVLSSFMINLLSLTGPLAIMVIYDQVIAKESTDMLGLLALGIAAAALFEIALRTVRARTLAYIGAKLDYQIASRVFEQVLHLPPLFTERAPVSGQLTRMREFDSFREIFSGPIAALVLDMPFTLIFVATIFILAGPLVLVPLVLIVLYIVLAAVVMPEIRRRTLEAGKSRSFRYSFLVELVWSMRVLKEQNSEKLWSDRYRKISAEASYENYRVNRISGGSNAVAQALMFGSGVATLGFGVNMVLTGDMSLGALIASMMLVWRILAPIQTVFTLGNRIEQLRNSIRQFTELLGYRVEQQPGEAPDVPIKFIGRLTINRVSMRYSRADNPALLGITLDIQPGEMIAVVGESGSGKSTLGKIAVGLYEPQAGSVLIDGVDIRQMPPINLRQAMGYVPQSNYAFPGTIADNILLADPTASPERLKHACRMAGILQKIEALPEGFETEFKDGMESSAPQGFLRQMAMARAFLADAPIYVLDEPSAGLDEEDERAFLRSLEYLRQRSTVIMMTQRPSHMRLCDRVLVLERGNAVLIDKPEIVVDVLLATHAERYQKGDATDGQNALAG